MISDNPQPGRGREGFDAFSRGLLVANWEHPDGALRLSAGLLLADLAEADFFMNTRTLLSALSKEEGAPATATGNLSRAFVGSIFERLKLSKPYRDSVRKVCKVVNEQDVWPLHLARVVAECAGLMARRKKRFQLTKPGRALLPDETAGALYRRLFLAYFRRFDLHYDFHLRDVPGIQQTMAVILWRLDTVARDWTPVRGLGPQILLPGVLDQLHAAMMSPHDTEEWILAGYVLYPLYDLRLLERKPRSEWPSVTERDHIRISPLWRKFLSFADATGGAM
jgi:hypothetical protein